MEERYFVVLSEDDERLKRHQSSKAAKKEAQRLAQKKGKNFYVLGTTGAFASGSSSGQQSKKGGKDPTVRITSILNQFQTEMQRLSPMTRQTILSVIMDIFESSGVTGTRQQQDPEAVLVQQIERWRRQHVQGQREPALV